MKKWLKKNLKNFDIIHMHDFRSYQNAIVCSFSIKYNIPYILQAHGSVLPFFERQGLKKIFDIFFGNYILKNATKCIAVSRREKQQYLQMGILDKDIEIIYNGIDLVPLHKKSDRGIFRGRYGINDNTKLILYLGRIHKSKGIDFLINSFYSYLTLNSNSLLVIIGPDAGYYKKLRRLIDKLGINNKVLFLGPMYGNDKNEALLDSDILIYPGSIEIFGLVPFEAIMCGTPVIVTNNCGCGEIIKEIECGYHVQYNDISDLSQKINYVLENAIENKEKIQKGQQYVMNHLNPEKYVENIVKLYQTIINPN
jgi:glycosyltransferase involved in cell wall biosynthesis